MMNYREAQRVADRIEEVAGPVKNAMTLAQLRDFGARLWPVTYEIFPDCDDDALNSLVDCLNQLDEAEALLWDAIQHIPHEKIKAMWAARWVDQGCPRVVLDGKYAALLMSTDAGLEIADMVRPPWKAFVLEIPEGLLLCQHPRTGTETSLTKILVHTSMDQGHLTWNLVMESADGVQLWRHGLETKEALVLDRERIHDWTKAAFLQPIETQDERLLVLAGRLVISACLAMSDPANIREQKPTKGRGGPLRRLNKTGPSIRTFIVGQPTKLDCRQAIDDFIHAGPGAKSLKVQFLVRGHWKRQAHGPSNQLRKLIHIEPYWKGPEEGKILTRSIQLVGEKGG